MRIITTIIMVFCGVFIAAGSPVALASDDKRAPIRIGAAEFRPQTYVENGKLIGSNVDIWRAMLLEAGLEWEDRVMPASRLYHSLTLGRGTIDGWLTVDIDVTRKLGTPVRPSLYPDSTLYLFARAGAEPQPLATLQADVLIVVIGYTYSGLLDQLKKRSPDTIVIVAPSHKVAFALLKAGRADYVLDYSAPGLYFVDQLGLEGVRHSEVNRQTVYFFVSHNVPDQAGIIARLSAASERILKRGLRQADLEGN